MDDRQNAHGRALTEARLEVESLERKLATRSSDSAPAEELRYLMKRLELAPRRVRSLVADGPTLGLLLLMR
jgi:hypothetical protein